ncbi:MAG: hypothetical protein ABR559_00630 [Gemmatimonadota bacterium]
MKAIVVATFVLLVTAGPGTGQVLRYGTDGGATRTYSRTQHDQVAQTANGQMQRTEVASFARFSVTLAEAGEKGLSVTIVHDSLSHTRTPAGPPADLSPLYGRPITVHMSSRGAVGEIVLPDSLPPEATRLDFGTAYRAFFPRLPETAVGPGDSWTDTLAFQTQQSGLDLSVQWISTYTMRGPAEGRGGGGRLVDVATAITLEGSGSQQGADISLSGTGTGAGTFTFDSAAGVLLGTTEEDHLTMTAFVSAGGQNILIPIEQVRNETVTLIE